MEVIFPNKATRNFFSSVTKYELLCKVSFLFGKFSTYADNKYNNNCFFNLYQEYYPRSSHQPHKLSGYVGLLQYFLVQIGKRVITVATFLIFHINCIFFIRSVFVTDTYGPEVTSQIIPPPPI